MNIQYVHSKHQQRGAVLVISVLLLLIITVMAVSSMGGSTMHEKMASNNTNKAASAFAAESGAAAFHAWLKNEFEASGWPGESDWNASDFAGVSTRVETNGDDDSVQFFSFQDVTWTAKKVELVVTGTSSKDGVVLGTSELALEIELTGGGGLPDAPAALSCFRGKCVVEAGAGQSVVDGHNYNLAPNGCSGRGGCFNGVSQKGENDKPGLYFESVGSTATVGNGASASCRYTGIPRLGANGCNNSQFSSSDFDEESRPASESYFGDDAFGAITSGDVDNNGNPLFGDRDDPKVTYIDSNLSESGGGNYAGTIIIDGATYSQSGNTMFEGLVVIRNCGVLGMSGTPFIYGAVIIDATYIDGNGDRQECPNNYKPFGGNGTPTIRYSLDALGLAGSSLGGGDKFSFAWKPVN